MQASCRGVNLLLLPLFSSLFLCCNNTRTVNGDPCWHAIVLILIGNLKSLLLLTNFEQSYDDPYDMPHVISSSVTNQIQKLKGFFTFD